MGTVWLNRPPTVVLSAFHLAALGHAESPGRTRHDLSEAARDATGKDRAAKSAARGLKEVAMAARK
jgi:hypothetical protein